jgi:hypothetical protein
MYNESSKQLPLDLKRKTSQGQGLLSLRHPRRSLRFDQIRTILLLVQNNLLSCLFALDKAGNANNSVIWIFWKHCTTDGEKPEGKELNFAKKSGGEKKQKSKIKRVKTQ